MRAAGRLFNKRALEALKFLREVRLAQLDKAKVSAKLANEGFAKLGESVSQNPEVAEILVNNNFAEMKKLSSMLKSAKGFSTKEEQDSARKELDLLIAKVNAEIKVLPTIFRRSAMGGASPEHVVMSRWVFEGLMKDELEELPRNLLQLSGGYKSAGDGQNDLLSVPREFVQELLKNNNELNEINYSTVLSGFTFPKGAKIDFDEYMRERRENDSIEEGVRTACSEAQSISLVDVTPRLAKEHLYKNGNLKNLEITFSKEAAIRNLQFSEIKNLEKLSILIRGSSEEENLKNFCKDLESQIGKMEKIREFEIALPIDAYVDYDVIISLLENNQKIQRFSTGSEELRLTREQFNRFCDVIKNHKSVVELRFNVLIKEQSISARPLNEDEKKHLFQSLERNNGWVEKLEASIDFEGVAGATLNPLILQLGTLNTRETSVEKLEEDLFDLLASDHQYLGSLPNQEYLDELSDEAKEDLLRQSIKKALRSYTSEELINLVQQHNSQIHPKIAKNSLEYTQHYKLGKLIDSDGVEFREMTVGDYKMEFVTTDLYDVNKILAAINSNVEVLTPEQKKEDFFYVKITSPDPNYLGLLIVSKDDGKTCGVDVKCKFRDYGVIKQPHIEEFLALLKNRGLTLEYPQETPPEEWLELGEKFSAETRELLDVHHGLLPAVEGFILEDVKEKGFNLARAVKERLDANEAARAAAALNAEVSPSADLLSDGDLSQASAAPQEGAVPSSDPSLLNRKKLDGYSKNNHHKI